MQGYCKALAVAPSAPDRIYAGGCINAAGAVVVSTDRGGTWVQTASAPADSICGLAVHPADPALVFAATTGGAYRTTDAGATWQRVWNGRGLRSILFSPGSAETLLVAGDAGVWLSPDAGANWQEMNEGLAVRAVNCLESGGPGGVALFAGTAGGAVYEYSFPTGVDEGAVVKAIAPCAAVVRGLLAIPQSAFRNPHSAVVLLDVTGRKALDLHPGANDVSRLVPGVYFVRMAEGGPRPATRKVVIE